MTTERRTFDGKQRQVGVCSPLPRRPRTAGADERKPKQTSGTAFIAHTSSRTVCHVRVQPSRLAPAVRRPRGVPGERSAESAVPPSHVYVYVRVGPSSRRSRVFFFGRPSNVVLDRARGCGGGPSRRILVVVSDRRKGELRLWRRRRRW